MSRRIKDLRFSGDNLSPFSKERAIFGDIYIGGGEDRGRLAYFFVRSKD